MGDEPLCSKMCQLKLEFAVMCVLIVVTWGLLAIPVIIYHTPDEQRAIDTSTPDNNSVDNLTCTSAFLYNGSSNICELELQKFRQCLPDASENSDILVLQDESKTVERVLNFLELDTPFFRISSKCREVAVPLLCLFFFGPVCDSRGVAYRPSFTECLQVSTNASLCANEWQLAQAFDVELPDCHSDKFTNDLPPSIICTVLEAENATDNPSNSSSEPASDYEDGTVPTDYTISQIDNLNVSSNCSLQCTEDFYCKTGANGDICTPTCQWKEYSPLSSDVSDAFVVFSAIVGVLAGIVVVVTGCMWRKRVFTFPSVIIIYQTATVVLLGIVVLISYVGRATLYCTSEDLLESISNPTPFCIVSGIVFYYGLLQVSCWWLCHVSILFWKITFPFHARSCDLDQRTRYIHIACVVVCFLLPLLPIIVIIGHDLRTNPETTDSSITNGAIGTLGFGRPQFPPIVCTGIDGDATFYSLVLPIIIILAIGLTLLMLMFWFVHKKNGDILTGIQATSAYRLGPIEKRILIIFLYYVFMNVLTLTTFTIFSRNTQAFAREVLLYFVCEQNGINPSHPCDRSKFESLKDIVPGLLSFVLLGIFPFVNLVFTMSTKELRDRFKRCLQTRKPIVSTCK